MRRRTRIGALSTMHRAVSKRFGGRRDRRHRYVSLSRRSRAHIAGHGYVERARVARRRTLPAADRSRGVNVARLDSPDSSFGSLEKLVVDGSLRISSTSSVNDDGALSEGARR